MRFDVSADMKPQVEVFSFLILCKNVVRTYSSEALAAFVFKMVSCHITTRCQNPEDRGLKYLIFCAWN